MNGSPGSAHPAALQALAAAPTAVPVDPDPADQDAVAQPVSLRDLLTRTIPPRKPLLKNLLFEGDLAMLHAARGIGKSRVAHALAVAVAAGGRVLRYEAPEPASVLLVDGELPAADLQRYLGQAIEVCDRAPTADFRVLSADLSGAPLPSLATTRGRDLVEQAAEGAALVVLDAITTLCPGIGPENDSESWTDMQAWLLDLRRKAHTVLVLHHDGKNGQQRGTSRREDVLSVVMQLRRPTDYNPREGCRVEVHLTKARSLTGDAVEPYEAALATGSDGRLEWVTRSRQDCVKAQVQELKGMGLSQREIAAEVGISQAGVCRILKGPW